MMRRRATPLACPGFRYEADSECSANRIRKQLNEVACGATARPRRQGTHDRRCTAFTTQFTTSFCGCGVRFSVSPTDIRLCRKSHLYDLSQISQYSKL